MNDTPVAYQDQKDCVDTVRQPLGRFWLLPVLVAALVSVAFAPAILPAFGGMDFLNLLYPQAILVKKSLAAGEIPLWNWHTWGGSPLLAAMQSAPLYPPMWLALALPLPAGLHLYTLAHLVFAGCGAAVLARRFTSENGAALFAAVAYAAGAFFVGHIEQANSVAAMSWAPWILTATLSVALRQRSCLVLSVAVALGLLAGHPQHVVLASLFAEIALLTCWLLDRRFSWRGVLLVQLGFAIAGSLAAAQILPTRELQMLSERVWPYTDPNSPALKWAFLPAVVVPRFFNALAKTPGQPIQYTELGLYCGLLTFPLFLLGAFVSVRRNRLLLALLITWAITLLFALGHEGGISQLFFWLVPFLQHSRGAARALNMETLLYAVFAGIGLGWLLARLPLHRRTLLATMAIVLLTADLALTHARELASLIVRLDEVRATAIRPKSTRLYRFMARDSDFYLDHDPRAVAQRFMRVQPNLNMLETVDTTDGYEEALLPGRAYANFLRRFNRNLRNDSLDAPLLALMGATEVFTEYPLRNPGPDWTLKQSFEFGGTTYRVFSSTFVPARFVQASSIGFGEITALRLATTDAAGQPIRNLALVSPEDSKARFHFEPSGNDVRAHEFTSVTAEQFNKAAAHAAITVVQTHTNALDLATTDTSARALLMLQTWFPGWKLRTSTGTQPILAGAPIFGIVSWPANTPSATVEYAPFAFRLGMFLTLATIAILAVSSFLWRKRQRT